MNNKTVDLKQLIKKIPKDKHKLPVILGKDGKNNTLIKELDDTLLVGKASSGKTTFLHPIINTILLTKTPEEVKLILIETKTNSFDIYKDIPHLFAPVVKDRKKAIGALKEYQPDILKRLRLLRGHTQSRSLEEYNKKYKEKFPYIVIIINEYSDLLNEFEGEENINRILGAGKFAGIYMILSTSEYSDDVVSKTIKNRCNSKMIGVLPVKKSRSLLGKKNVENLQGMGDMIYKNTQNEEKIRVQTPWISSEQREDIVKEIIQKFPKEGLKEDLIASSLFWHTQEELEDRLGKGRAKTIEQIELYPIFIFTDDKDNYFIDSLIYGVLKTYDFTNEDIEQIARKYNINISQQKKYYKKLLLKQVEEHFQSDIPNEFFLEEALMSSLISLRDRTSIDFAIPFFRNSVKLLPSSSIISDYIHAEIDYLFENPSKRNKDIYKKLKELFKKIKKEELLDYIWDNLVLINYCLTDLLEEDHSKDEYIKEIKDERIISAIKERSCSEILFGEDYI